MNAYTEEENMTSKAYIEKLGGHRSQGEDWSSRLREFIHVSCIKCDFNCGGYYRRDITPTRPMTFECKRDREWDEKAHQMYESSPCGAKWDIAVTEEAYEKWLFDVFKEEVLKKVLKDNTK